MKLRNKNTGEVFDALIREKGGGGSYSLIVCDIKDYEQSKSTLDETHFILDEYDSLAELNEEWEDFGGKDVRCQTPLAELSPYDYSKRNIVTDHTEPRGGGKE